MERIKQAQICRDGSTNTHVTLKKARGINPRHSISDELWKKVATDKSNQKAKDPILERSDNMERVMKTQTLHDNSTTGHKASKESMVTSPKTLDHERDEQ